MDAQELDRRGELLAHAWNGGEVQICEACRQWFRLEETHSMDEGGWICKGCAGSGGSVSERPNREVIQGEVGREFGSVFAPISEGSEND